MRPQDPVGQRQGGLRALGADGDVTLIRCLHLPARARAEGRDAAHACSLREAATLLLELGNEAVQQRHRIELRLIARSHAAAVGKRHASVIDPFDGQTG
jgi:hypothetical protein